MKTCVIVLDVKDGATLFRTGDKGGLFGAPLRWREWDKRQARSAAQAEGARFGEVVDYRPVNVKGRRFALALVRRRDGEGGDGR